MKKNLILALSVAAAPLFAGEPAPVTVVTPPAPAPCPWGVEVAAVHGWALGDISDRGVSKEIDVCGADVTATYTINQNHSVNLRFGYTFGDEMLNGAMLAADPTSNAILAGGLRQEIDVHTFSIMPGYRYTHDINDKLSVYAGVNAGISNVSVKSWFGGAFGLTDGVNKNIVSGRLKDHDSAWGFAYSFEIGANYKLTDNWSAFATWGVFGNTAEPKLYPYSGPYQPSVDQQYYHGIRVGVGYKF